MSDDDFTQADAAQVRLNYLDDIAHVIDADADDLCECTMDPTGVVIIIERLHALAAKIRKEEPVR